MLLLPLVDGALHFARFAILATPAQRVEDPVFGDPNLVGTDSVDEEETETKVDEGQEEVDGEGAPAVLAEQGLEALRPRELFFVLGRGRWC